MFLFLLSTAQHKQESLQRAMLRNLQSLAICYRYRYPSTVFVLRSGIVARREEDPPVARRRSSVVVGAAASRARARGGFVRVARVTPVSRQTLFFAEEVRKKKDVATMNEMRNEVVLSVEDTARV